MSMPRDPDEPRPQGDPGGWGTPPGEPADQTPSGQQGAEQNPASQPWGNPDPASQGPGNQWGGQNPGNQQWGDQNPGNQQWGNQNPGNQQWGGQDPNQQWGGQGYGTPAGYGGPQGAPSNGMGTAALILGIIGLLLSIFVIGGPIGLVAVILGFIGRGKAKRGEANNGGQALAGIITGGIAILVSIAVLAAGAAFFNEIRDCADPSLTQAEVDQCVEDRLLNNE